MHSATNLVKIGATVIKRLAEDSGLKRIIFIDSNDLEFTNIADELLNEKCINVNICAL